MAIITVIATAMMTLVIIVRINSIVHSSNSTEVRVVMTVKMVVKIMVIQTGQSRVSLRALSELHLSLGSLGGWSKILFWSFGF